MDQDKVIERIRKLLALSTSSNEFEAAEAAAKAQELLLKYNLSMATVDVPETDAVDRVNWLCPDQTWQQVLVNGIATTNLCQVVRYDSKSKLAIFGSMSNVEVVEYLYSYLAAAIDRLCQDKCKGQGVAYKNAWRQGAIHTVCQKLREGIEQFKAASPQSMALILVKDKAVIDRCNIDFPYLTKVGKATVSNTAGYYQGRADGQGIAIRQGLRTNAVGQHLLR